MWKSFMLGAALSATVTITAQAAETVNFWYHFDNPDNPMSELVAKFEKANPDIKIEAENIPWNSYYDNLYTSIIGGNAPDAAMVKLFAQPRLVEMEALEPLDEQIDGWTGKSDLLDNLLELNKASDGKQYYLPIQYVVLYLYYRADMFKEAGLEPPKTCEDFRNAAIKLTDAPHRYGFGLRGGKAGWDHWGAFVLSQSGDLQAGGLLEPDAVAANQWIVDLFQKDKVIPPSAPNDGFQEIIAALKGGKTAMTIHHIGSSNDLVKALGDKISAVPVPECGGKRWTSYGDESLAIFSASEVKEAAWKWISFLAEAENNISFNRATGQMTVTKSGSEQWNLHERRFVEATVDSLPFAHTLPQTEGTSEFVNTAWQIAMQRALTGQMTSEEMMVELDKLFQK